MKRLTMTMLACLLAASLQPAAQAQQKRHTVTQTVATTSFAFLPVYVAEHMGFFAEEGVELKTLRVQSAAAGVAATASGNVNYYLSSPAAGIQAAARGANVRLFAAVMTEYPGNIVVTREVAARHRITDNTPLLQRLDALKGLKMAAHSPGSAPDQLLRYVVRAQNMNPESDLTILPITDTSILAAMEQKRIDGFSYSSPLADTAVVRYGARILLSLASGEFKPLAGLLSIAAVANKDWVEKEPEAAAAVARAIWRGQLLLRSDPMKAREAARKAFAGTEPAVFDQAFETNRRAFPDSPALTRAMVERVYEFHRATGGQPITAPVEQVFNNSAVELAAKTLKR